MYRSMLACISTVIIGLVVVIRASAATDRMFNGMFCNAQMPADEQALVRTPGGVPDQALLLNESTTTPLNVECGASVNSGANVTKVEWTGDDRNSSADANLCCTADLEDAS